MWKARNLSQQLSSGAGIADEELDSLSILRQTYRKNLIVTFSSRASIDQLRLYATGSLCDLHLTFATMRPVISNFRPSSSTSQLGGNEKFKVLVQQIESSLVHELTSIFDGAEKQYAKKAKKDRLLNEPAEDEDPVDDEESSDDEDDDEGLSKEERLAAELKAEKALCELTAKYVLVITANLVDTKGNLVNKLKRRLQRNETKLGHNFKEVAAYLDEEKMAKRNKKPTKSAPAEKPQKPAMSAEIIHDEDEDDDIFEDAEPEEGSREDLRRRGLLDDPIEDDEDNEEHEDVEGLNHDEDEGVLGD
jgi:cohesin complex subunit SA-1/2